MAKLRVRARAVDMLGRQQIAGIPTAIHELFKNAHDAYAERVEIDYFRRTKVMVIRDDGYGMTRNDVENRWLTLGTESRLKSNRPDSKEDWTGPKGLPRRMIMGEKGIGRLAIAVIAPITLLLTRAVRQDGLHDLIAVLVHWGLFEQAGLDIGMIDVPIIEFPGGTLPTREDVHRLVHRVRRNIEELEDQLEQKEFDKLNSELDKMKIIAPDKLDQTLYQFVKKGDMPLTLSGDGYGTYFILLPTAQELDDDIDGGSGKDATNLERFLLGFSNTMAGGQSIIQTEFRDHHLDEYPRELIGPANFFLPEEYERADHHIKGDIDNYGQFNGTVRVYDKVHPFVCNWADGKGRHIKCGSFSLDFAYVMGRPNESRLNSEDHKAIIDKLDRIGGLYIYRNDIRILPYGNTDYDFLEIEKRRTKSAHDWFFSHRRMMGHIAISHEENATLNEKAGREGFRQNQAYRDFRAVLINLFERLAKEFFRSDAPQAEAYLEQRQQIAAEAELLAKQRKKAEERRKSFGKQLDGFFEGYETGRYDRYIEEIQQQTDERLKSLLTVEDEGDFALSARQLEAALQVRLQRLETDITLSKPRGLSLTKKLEKDWAAYQRVSGDLRENVIEPLRKEISGKIRDTTGNRITEAQRRESVMELMEKQKASLVHDISGLRNAAYAAHERMKQTLKTVLREEFSLFQQTVERLLVDFTRRTAQNSNELEEARSAFERELLQIRERETSLLDAIKRQMIDFAESLKERETVDDKVGALEQQAQRLEEQLEFYSDFAQMGMAVGILQHEFEKTARDMRTAMRDMKPWADGTPALGKIYKRLRKSFDHLDDYLKVLDPLGRRLYRSSVNVSGDEIRMHLLRIFGKELDESGIALTATAEFVTRTVKCHSSALLGAFINIMDNAIYWIVNGAKHDKTIRLDVDGEGFLISNTGPGIVERMRERIFEFGESTKPGGRGMGLSISRDTLRKEGFDLELIRDGANVEPVFRIKTVIKEMEEEDDE